MIFSFPPFKKSEMANKSVGKMFKNFNRYILFFFVLKSLYKVLLLHFTFILFILKSHTKGMKTFDKINSLCIDNNTFTIPYMYLKGILK